jgi:molecular chaperone DnaJ
VSESKIRIPIPAGIEDGMTLQMSGAGAVGERGSSAGDLLVTVHVKKHPLFERKGQDIFINQDISFAQATLGDSLSVQTLDERMRIKIPAGTQSGELFRLAGKGISGRRFGGRGDAYVRIRVVVPRKLSREARKLVEQLKKLDD